MSGYLALAVSVGLLAVLDTWFFVGPLATILPGLVWISFIAWGCHFHSGAGVKGCTTAIVGMSFGALVGMVAVMLASGPLAGTGQFAAPIAVGLGAFVICLASKIPPLATIPASCLRLRFDRRTDPARGHRAREGDPADDRRGDHRRAVRYRLGEARRRTDQEGAAARRLTGLQSGAATRGSRSSARPPRACAGRPSFSWARSIDSRLLSQLS
jgi:hypothetical protein